MVRENNNEKLIRKIIGKIFCRIWLKKAVEKANDSNQKIINKRSKRRSVMLFGDKYDYFIHYFMKKIFLSLFLFSSINFEYNALLAAAKFTTTTRTNVKKKVADIEAPKQPSSTEIRPKTQQTPSNDVKRKASDLEEMLLGPRKKAGQKPELQSDQALNSAAVSPVSSARLFESAATPIASPAGAYSAQPGKKSSRFPPPPSRPRISRAPEPKVLMKAPEWEQVIPREEINKEILPKKERGQVLSVEAIRFDDAEKSRVYLEKKEALSKVLDEKGALEGKSDGFRQNITDAKVEIKKLRNEIKELENSTSSKSSEKTKLRITKKELLKKIAGLEDSISNIDRQKTELAPKIHGLFKQSRELRKEIQASEKNSSTPPKPFIERGYAPEIEKSSKQKTKRSIDKNSPEYLRYREAREKRDEAKKNRDDLLNGIAGLEREQIGLKNKYSYYENNIAETDNMIKNELERMQLPGVRIDRRAPLIETKSGGFVLTPYGANLIKQLEPHSADIEVWRLKETLSNMPEEQALARKNLEKTQDELKEMETNFLDSREKLTSAEADYRKSKKEYAGAKKALETQGSMTQRLEEQVPQPGGGR